MLKNSEYRSYYHEKWIEANGNLTAILLTVCMIGRVLFVKRDFVNFSRSKVVTTATTTPFIEQFRYDERG